MPAAEETTRTLTDYLATIRRRLWLTGLVAVVTVVAAGAYTFHQPTMYRATMKVVIGQQGGAFQLNVGNVADQFTQTMSDLIQSDVVATAVVDRLHLGMAPTDLLNRLTVRTKPSTSVMTVAYEDTDPARAVRILASVGDVFTTMVADRLAVPPAQKDQNVTVSATVFDPDRDCPGGSSRSRRATWRSPGSWGSFSASWLRSSVSSSTIPFKLWTRPNRALGRPPW